VDDRARRVYPPNRVLNPFQGHLVPIRVPFQDERSWR
jgi:hypothetical protein